MELVAYLLGKRNDFLASQQDAAQRAQIAKLDNSTQELKTVFRRIGLRHARSIIAGPAVYFIERK